MQINLKTPTRGFMEIPLNRISLNSDNTLTVEVRELEDALGLYENQLLVFNRYVYTSSKKSDVIMGVSKIIKKDNIF